MAQAKARRGRGPKAVGEILARYMRTSGLKDTLRSPAIYDCWPEAAGDEAAQHSRVVGFKDSVLHVEVDSAPWLQMLATFRKADLLAGVQQLVRSVRVTDIRFRIGAGATGPDASEQTAWPPKKHPPTTRGTSRSFRA